MKAAHARSVKPTRRLAKGTKRLVISKTTSRRSNRKKLKPQTRAIVVKAPDRKPWLLAPEEVTILKNAICKGATDDELKYCLAVARRFHLDPFQQQIWFVPRWDKEAESTGGQKGNRLYVPVVGINGMLHIAARDHRDFGTYSEPEYGPMIEVDWQYKGNGRTQKLKVPEWCRIEARKKGCAEPTVAKVWWTEIYPNTDFAPLVRRMPRLMLAKCAKAQATRTSYPSTGGLLIPEETHSQEFTDITPGGRIIVHPEPEGDLEAATAAADAKNQYLDAFEAKERAEMAKIAGTPIPCLWYQLHEESQTYEITGDDTLKKAHRDLLAPLWNGGTKTIVAQPEQLGKLISQFEQREVPFRELKRP